MFVFLKHYLCWMFPLVVGSRIEMFTTTTVPLINNGEWDVVLIPQFIEPPNPFMHSMGHFILNIVDAKERHVYVVNTLSRIRSKLYKGVSLTSYGYTEVEVKQQTNGTDCGFMCCYYMYRTVKLKLSVREWHNVLRYEEGEYREFIDGIIHHFNGLRRLCQW